MGLHHQPASQPLSPLPCRPAHLFRCNHASGYGTHLGSRSMLTYDSFHLSCFSHKSILQIVNKYSHTHNTGEPQEKSSEELIDFYHRLSWWSGGYRQGISDAIWNCSQLQTSNLESYAIQQHFATCLHSSEVFIFLINRIREQFLLTKYHLSISLWYFDVLFCLFFYKNVKKKRHTDCWHTRLSKWYIQ